MKHLCFQDYLKSLEVTPTLRGCGAESGIEVQAAILQNAVVLNPDIFASVQLVEEPQALWVFDGQGWQCSVMQCDIYPHMVL